MRAIDTNVLVRLLVRDDDVQTKQAQTFIERGAWVSHLVLAETLWVLGSSFNHSHDKLASAIEMLMIHPDISIQDVDVVMAALAAYRANKKVDFSDCLILAIAEKAGHLPVGTFDRDLAKLDGAVRVDTR